MRLIVVLAFAGFVSCVMGQDVTLHEVQTVGELQPIVIEHAQGERLSVSIAGGGEIPETQIRRFPAQTVFVVKGGEYLLRVGQRLAAIRVEGEAVMPEAKLKIWAYMGEACQPCEAWKSKELAALQSRRDVVVYVVPPGQHDKTRTPAFVMQFGDKVIERTGYDGSNYTTAAAMLAAAGL